MPSKGRQLRILEHVSENRSLLWVNKGESSFNKLKRLSPQKLPEKQGVEHSSVHIYCNLQNQRESSKDTPGQKSIKIYQLGKIKLLD